ncbi:MAG: aminomethyl-transferring glycine dehydrogenase subunit GcvPA [Planctomycetota bacterium]|jgi:glycine dehydrogenase subunit 1
MAFIPHTDDDRSRMLSAIGVDRIDDLFADIPPELRCGQLNLSPGKSEQEVLAELTHLAGRNATDLTLFVGGGFYDHYMPAAVGAIAGRSEFVTSYTPYQSELSQGTLQAIYEYQSAICRLTEMEVANASLYDGGTALYEAVMMALRITGRNRVIVDEGVSPIYRTMLRSYTTNLGIAFDEIPTARGLADRDRICSDLNDETAAVVLANPNFFGCLDDFSDLAESLHRRGALMIVSTYPVALGLIKTPGAMGADIVTGEGQSLGLPLSFGGPYLGFMAARMQHVRKMPGRICGRTVDAKGRDGFVLTLQAREQHIRREKATSNICTNQNLCALTSLVYMSLLGKHGLRGLAQLCADKAHYAYERLTAIPGVRMRYPGRWFFNEFVLELPSSAKGVINHLLERGIAAGFPLSRYYDDMDNCLLLAVTEKRTKEEIDHLVSAVDALV